MIQVRQAKRDSLLIPNSRATYRLRSKLEKRLETFEGIGLFITLTYDREDYDNPYELYRVQSEERHIRRFIQRLSSYLGQSLTARWIRKMEFQNGGWLHWHVIIDSPKRIPHDDLTMLWGHGYCWINKINTTRIGYFTKYVSKEDAVPSFLLAERARSVKVVASSPGFWKDTDRKRGETKVSVRWAVYTPLAHHLKQRTEIRVDEKTRIVQLDLYSVLTILDQFSTRTLENEYEWFTRQIRRKDLEQFNEGIDQAVKNSGASAPPLLDTGGYSAKRRLIEYEDWIIPCMIGCGVLT